MPWLREHLSGWCAQYLSSVEVRIERGAAGGLPSLPDPAQLVEAFREGGLAALVQTKEQRALMGRMQAAMAVVEGYSEHVMDAIARGGDPRPRRSCARRWTRAGAAARRPSALVERLLGLDMKLRQYEQGKASATPWWPQAGMEALNRVWERPRRCPTEPSWTRRPTGWRASGPLPPPPPEPGPRAAPRV